MFQLTQDEFANLKSQIATSSLGWGGRRKAPLVFTEHEALQAAAENKPVHQMQKAGAFIKELDLTTFLAFSKFCGSLLHW